jgi:hypothetical protein
MIIETENQLRGELIRLIGERMTSDDLSLDEVSAEIADGDDIFLEETLLSPSPLHVDDAMRIAAFFGLSLKPTFADEEEEDEGEAEDVLSINTVCVAKIDAVEHPGIFSALRQAWLNGWGRALTLAQSAPAMREIAHLRDAGIDYIESDFGAVALHEVAERAARGLCGCACGAGI